MKQQNIIKKAMAFLLVFCLVAVEYGSCTYAETISETNEFAEKQQENTNEKSSTDEVATTEEESTEKSIAVESNSETETMVQTEETVSKKHEITGFVSLDDSERTITCSYSDKPAETELLDELPSTLKVYLDYGTEIQEIPVTWRCAGDFDSTAFFYYEYDPIWDNEKYELSTNEKFVSTFSSFLTEAITTAK